MKSNYSFFRIVLIGALMLPGPAISCLGQKTVMDLKYHEMQNYSWMRLARIVPEVTDRVILPVGTVESHGACPIGTDNFIPVNLANLVWKDINALVAPVVNHGVSGTSISQFPGTIMIRPDIFQEYIYDILKDLVRTGFKNVLIINGHGGNTEPIQKAITRLHVETGAHFMIINWWEAAWNLAEEVYGQKPIQSGHGDLEEAALVMSEQPELIDREMYEKLGKDNLGHAGTDKGVIMMPAWATTRLPEAGAGYLDFDVKKAKEYTLKKAKFIADTFNEAVSRWEMMESWK
jgi:creatinine amidohydrolase